MSHFLYSMHTTQIATFQKKKKTKKQKQKQNKIFSKCVRVKNRFFLIFLSLKKNATTASSSHGLNY